MTCSDTADPARRLFAGAAVHPTEGTGPAAYFFALDSTGRTAWPFRFVPLPGGDRLAQRWRFGRWIDSSEAAAFADGTDDLWVEATEEEVLAWIGRQYRTCGLTNRERAAG
ncbi:hypothetical protein [Rhodocista pekingensis]|uniref:Uncharacterized protein n=1 Tax=Rhodocista pekingensis TaxID=201185 RepID=A0ABW2KVP2_9PROT